MIKSRVVFIGNIPYDKSETQLVNIFSEVGTVLSFRLVFDRETGKPKGYGFCTFQDYETAASAVRNLNNYDIGGRQLRVDFADADKESQDEPDKRRMPAESQSSVDVIPQIVNQMDPQQLAEVLSYLKLMATSNPEQVHTLLNQNPQIAYGVLQALLQMNIVDQYSMQRIISAQNANNPKPVFQSPSFQAPQQPAPNPQLTIQLEEQQKQLMLQLINLTPEQIQALPPDQQQQVIQLRAQIMGQ